MTVEKNLSLSEIKFPEKINLPEMPIFNLLRSAAKNYPTRVCIISNDNKITFKKLYEEALKFGNALKRLGYGKGDVISVHMPNCIQYPIAYYAILSIGAIFSPVNPLLPKNDLKYQLINNESKIVIAHQSFAKLLFEISSEVQLQHIIITTDEEEKDEQNITEISDTNLPMYSFNELKLNEEINEIGVLIDPTKDVAHLCYTGGTTGKPKAVIHSHYNMVSCCIQNLASNGIFPLYDEEGTIKVAPYQMTNEQYKQIGNTSLPGEGSMMSPAPLYHMGGIMGLNTNVLNGYTTVLINRFVPEDFLKKISMYKVTCIAGAPPMFSYLVNNLNFKNSDLSSLTSINSATAPISEALMKQLEESFPNATVTEGYGLTEATSSAICSSGFKESVRKLGTVGKPIYNTEVKVVSVSGESNESLGPNERGEILVKGPQIALGYYKNPEETSITFIEDGWLRTGDIGIIDEDGFVSIVDRKKEMIIYNGYNVYPSQIEEIFYEHPAVLQAVVLGQVDEVNGEIPVAFIVKRPGNEASESEIMSYVNERVVHYSKVRKLVFLEQLPVTAVGKISKVELKRIKIGN